MLPSKEYSRVDADPPLSFGRIPFDIPDDTEVPLWAYLDVTVCTRLVKALAPSPNIEQEENNFNLTAARALASMCRREYAHCILFDKLSRERFERVQSASVESYVLRFGRSTRSHP